MSWSEALICSALRSFIIAFCGTVIAVIAQAWLRNVAPQRKHFAWGFLLLPFFVPSLMTGFCYRDTSMALVHSPWLREFLYALIVMMQTVPVGVIILHFSPPAETSASSLYSAGLIRLKLLERLKLLLSSHCQYRIAAFCMLFLLSFQESDLAALMQASGWTEWMFTKHIGGLALGETIRLSLWPVLIQVPMLVPIVIWLGKDSSTRNGEFAPPREVKFFGQLFVIFWVAIANVFVFAIPFIQMIKGTMVGIDSLLQQPSIFRELGDAFLLATTSALLTIIVAAVVFSNRNGQSLQRLRIPVLFFLLLPGSMGSLALGLLLAGIFQTETFQFAYDTPLPLILGEFCLILPKALILIYCLGKLNPAGGEYWVSLLNQSQVNQHQRTAKELAWQMTGRRRFAILVIVWFWAYFEVMLPSILAMPGLAPIGLVLYNNLHYGRIAALGAKLALMLLLPIISAVGYLLVRRKLSKLSHL